MLPIEAKTLPLDMIENNESKCHKSGDSCFGNVPYVTLFLLYLENSKGKKKPKLCEKPNHLHQYKPIQTYADSWFFKCSVLLNNDLVLFTAHIFN